MNWNWEILHSPPPLFCHGYATLKVTENQKGHFFYTGDVNLLGECVYVV